jgi:serine/threonine-protein kinase
VAALGSASGATLTPELQGAAARRLGALALLVACVTATLGAIPFVGAAGAPLDARLRAALLGLDVATALGLYAAIARGWLPAGRALWLAPVFEVVHGFLSSVAFHAAVHSPGVEVRGWTTAAVWMMVFPLLVPLRPARVVAATVATAAMDPLALLVNVAAGVPAPSPAALGQLFLPTAVACLLAPIGARIVYGLTVQVKEAREMGAYRLVEKLGQGGMGEVWRAEHRMLARSAAIKLIRPAALGAGDPGRAREMVKRFEREARATAALRSPHTIAVYDFGLSAEGTFHYVMELLEGFSLQTLVDRFGPVPPERAVALLLAACHSLEEAHASGLVHRDVKPANLFVCRLGLDVDFLKVLDFGLVKLQGERGRGAEHLTVEDALTGTPGFMPPEVALGLEPIDGRADLYALGCVAYWLLTGKPVFEGANAMQMVVDHVRAAPVPPSQRSAQPVPEALERIVLRCLEKDPAARPPSAEALAADLRALGIGADWTAERARGWWSTCAPAAAPDVAAPARDAEVERSRDATLTQVHA